MSDFHQSDSDAKPSLGGTTRWGILGCGGIAAWFAQALKNQPAAGTLVAISSRSEERRHNFKQRFPGIQHDYADFEDMLRSDSVDVVYVATPYGLHHQHMIRCIEKGKAVLCEKPFTKTLQEAEEVIALARQRNVFVCESMWMRFFPVMREVKRAVDSGAIGDVQRIRADMGFHLGDSDPNHPLLNPAAGGGADIEPMVYPAHFAHFILGEVPEAAVGVAIRGPTGACTSATAVHKYRGGQTAALTSSYDAPGLRDACVVGSAGHILVPSPFWHPKEMTIKNGWKLPVDSDMGGDVVPTHITTKVSDYTGNGMEFVALAVARAVSSGLTECSEVPHQATLDVMQAIELGRKGMSWF